MKYFFAVFLLLAFGIIPISFSQTIGQSAESNLIPTQKIIWGKVKEYDLPKFGKLPILTFDHSQYDFGKNFFPIYVTRLALPVNTTNVVVVIGNPQYELCTDEEQHAIKISQELSTQKISDVISIKSEISYLRKLPVAYVEFVPIRKNPLNGNLEKLVSFSLQLSSPTFSDSKYAKKLSHEYTSSSVLATGKWDKISVLKDGIYKIDVAFLKSLGLETDSILSRDIRIYGNGGGQLPFANASYRADDLQENSIYVADFNNNNIFDSTDYVLFYGQSQHRWKYSNVDNKFHHIINLYSDTTYYFINTDLGPGKRIQVQNSSTLPITKNVISFDDFDYHELEQTNLLKSGRMWLGETFDILNSYQFDFNFPAIEATSKVYVKVDVAARYDSPGTNFSWSAGGVSSVFNVMGVSTANYYSTYFQNNFDTLSFFPSSGNIGVNIQKTTPSPAIGWLNFIEVNARRLLTIGNGQLLFRDKNSVGVGNIAQYALSNANILTQVWDVTHPTDVKLQQINFSGSSIDFALPSDSLKEFVAFIPQSCLTPQKTGKVPNQNLHSMSSSDFIIVAPPLFIKQAHELAEIHQKKDNMSVSVATTEEIFNEFSSGAQDVSAIRDFVRMFYERAKDSTELPKYLLLFGRGSYNSKANPNSSNYIVAYESANSNEPTLSYPSDDFFGLLDSSEGNWDVTSDALDIGIGRFPINSVSEAEIMVNKVVRYISVPESIVTTNSCSTDACYGLGDWRNQITFCADDEDNDEHIKQADQIASKVSNTNKNYNVDKIYLDAFQQFTTPGGERYPDATESLMRRMDKGNLIVNYTGHGGELGWSHERFLEIYNINSWKNQCKLPLFFTATCDFSRWDDPTRVSAGELTLLNPNGGGIGLMTTTRVVYSGPNFELNYAFYNHAFTPLPNGEMPRLGDLMKLSKLDMAPGQINHRNFSLLADPALALNYPKYEIATTHINGVPINNSKLDTSNALSTVSVSGEVQDKNGIILSDFTGIIFPTVYDKATKITTLSNDGAVSPPYTFDIQKNILFKGKASVVNGKFSFSFIVPKDISYNFGQGRISYYSHNGFVDASGSFQNFVIGGTNAKAVSDLIGPEIKLFLNDDKFIFGGITNSDPRIYFTINDSSGINTAGTSIGHDITAVLDGDNTKPFILNDYYESNIDDFRKGTVRYPLSGLKEGRHTLTVKAWDTYNNSSSSSTEFVVASSGDIALKHVLNYPNPFTTSTAFYFEHNKCCTLMDIEIQIFTVSGKVIKSIQQTVYMEGFRSEPIYWDGKDDFGNKIGQGVYIYRLRVKPKAGSMAEVFEKLVILK